MDVALFEVPSEEKNNFRMKVKFFFLIFIFEKIIFLAKKS